MSDNDREIHLFIGSGTDVVPYKFSKGSLAWVAIERQIKIVIDQGKGIVTVPLGHNKGSASYVYSPFLTIRWVERPTQELEDPLDSGVSR